MRFEDFLDRNGGWIQIVIAVALAAIAGRQFWLAVQPTTPAADVAKLALWGILSLLVPFAAVAVVEKACHMLMKRKGGELVFHGGRMLAALVVGWLTFSFSLDFGGWLATRLPNIWQHVAVGSLLVGCALALFIGSAVLNHFWTVVEWVDLED